jgi:hypothetical protein
MSKQTQTLTVNGNAVNLFQVNQQDYISLTDMVRTFGDEAILYNWMRNRNTLEFIGIWEKLNNPNFKPIEFETFKKRAGLNSFHLTPPKWIEATNAIGMISKSGRYGGGTFAHKDIAFEFGSWLSPEFKLYLIKEYQHLKEKETTNQSLEWNLHRTLAKINYQILTDAIKENLIPPEITPVQSAMIYSSESELLNMALFGKTSAKWKKENPKKVGTIRDRATIHQLVILSNLESINSIFIREKIPQGERIIKLNAIAIIQMKSLLTGSSVKNIE